MCDLFFIHNVTGVNKMKRLLLASGSDGRKKLMSEALIPFEVVTQDADESVVSLDDPLKVVVQNLARLKMDHVVLPEDLKNDQEIFIITADTLTVGHDGFFLGKPKSREHAIEMIKSHRGRLTLTGTGFCVEKRICIDGVWKTDNVLMGYAEGACAFEVSDENIDFYLDNIPFLTVSGGVALGKGHFGQQFLKEVQGSYAAIIGLPMFELRQALIEVGFL